MRRIELWRRRWRVCLLLAVVAAAAGPAGVGRADTQPYIDHQAWSATGLVAPGETEGTVYVSTVADQEQARTYIDLAVATLPAAQLAESTLLLQEAEGGLASAPARLHACALLTPLDVDGRVEGRAATIDCEGAQTAERDGSGSWSVPLARFATALRTSRIAGIALVPAADDVTPSTFTVAFKAARTTVDVPGAAAAAPSRSGAQPPLDQRSEENAQSGQGGSSSLGGAGASGFVPGFAPEQEEEGASFDALPDLPTVTGDFSAPTAAAVEQAPTLPVTAAASTAAPGSSRLPLVLFLLSLAGTALLLGMQGRVRIQRPVAEIRVPTRFLTPASAAVGLPAILLLWTSETTTYKFGVVAIVFIAAIGLHILVNTAGELSLAHAAFVGIPAFTSAQLSAEAGLNPVLAVPLAVAIGVLLGGIVALIAMRARGLQVALATLAVAIATVQFLWFREWLVGPQEGFTIPNPSFLGYELESSKSRTPVLVLLVLVAVLAGTAVLRSKLGRGMSLMRSSPDVAAAAGVPVALYRGAAYAFAGAFAGLAGGAYVIWVQQVTPQAFPLQLGFTYLLIAALAGRGGLGGVAVAAVAVQAGALFTFLPETIALYIAPLGLIIQITRFEGGINAGLRDMRARLNQILRSKPMSDSSNRELTSTTPPPAEVTGVRLPVALGVLMVVAGFGAIGLAWYNAGNTSQLWIQNQYIVSGSLTGLGLIITGCALLLRDALLTGTSLVRGSVDLRAEQPQTLPETSPPSETEREEAPSSMQPLDQRTRMQPQRTTATRKLSSRSAERISQ